MISEQEFTTKQDQSRKDGFNRWMSDPITKALISLIPPCDHLEVLLQASYEAGFNSGGATTAMQFISAVMKPRTRE